jgi:hypothetical protein
MAATKVYLAAAYERGPEMRVYRDALHALGHEVTSRWIDQKQGQEAAGAPELVDDPGAYARFALKDIADLRAAETVISFTGGGGRGGRHVELGLAIALGKRLVVVGPREHVFHTLADIEWYPDWPSYLEA